MADVWRVVLASGEVREVEVYRVDTVTRYADSRYPWCAVGMCGRTPHGAVVAAMSMKDWDVAEILAPGEMTRAEALTALEQRAVVLEAEAIAVERERCARVCDAVAAERQERLRALESEGISPHDQARLALVVAIMDAETCAAKIREGGV